MSKKRRAEQFVLGLFTLFSGLVVGCAHLSRGELYTAHEAIRLGEAFPDTIEFPDGAKHTQRGDIHIVELSRKWNFGRVDEQATYLIDTAGILVGKDYTLVRGEAFLLFVWQYERCVSELEIYAGSGTTLDEIEAKCDRLRSEYTGIPLSPEAHDRAAFFAALRSHGGVEREDFKFDRTANVKFFPFLENTTWHARRIGGNTLRLWIEDRKDVCPLIVTPMMWLTYPFYSSH